MRLTRLAGGLLLVGASTWLGGCSQPVEDIDRTQPNLLSKDLFQGEWYFARTVVDVPFESSGTFIGDRQEYHIGAEDFPAYKVRWRLEEKLLYACRVDEIILGGNSAGRTEGDEENPSKEEARALNDAGEKFPCTHPVVAFPVQHIDVIRSYNSSTGEQSNVLVENSSDRHWHERDYVRVNWNDQRLTEVDLNIFGQATLGWVGRLTGSYYVQAEEGDCRVANEDGTMNFSECQEGYVPPMIEEESIMITNRMTLEPSSNWGGAIWTCFATSLFGGGAACTNSEIGMRYSFNRVPNRTPEEAYEPLYYPDEVFERVGVWRVIKHNYINGRGTVDFKQKLGTRFKIWEQTHSCDEAGNCTPIPLRERTLKPIDYYLNRTFPQDLKPAAFEVAKEWNDAMNGVKPGVDLTETCQVVCAEGKSMDQCSATDDNWRMEGECAFRLWENSGEQFLGDLRYNFIAFIEDPGQGQPCGVGGPANDPETGELINGVSYVYGAGCFDFLETRVADMIDLECANRAQQGETLPAGCDAIDENEFLRGMRTLEIMQAQGYKRAPTTPITALTGAMTEGVEMAGSERMAELKGNLEELRQFRGTLHTRRQKLRDAGISRAIIPDDLAYEISGGLASSAAELTDEELEMIDPLAPPGGNGMARLQKITDQLAARAAEPAEYLFTDNGLWHFVQQHMDLDREELLQVLRENAFKAVTLHELGHNMGLRHNFVASFDRANYFPEYWDIKTQSRLQFEEDYGRPAPVELTPFQGRDETPEEFATRYAEWDRDRQLLREIEELNGSRLYKYSSIMDYHGAYYGDWQGLGSYDQAAMRFLYAGLVDRVNCTGTRPEDCINSETEGLQPLHDRTWVRWYKGGELCSADSDCPAAASGQICKVNGELGASFCSNWDEDEKASGRFNPRQAFCSDDRVSDQPFCNRFDEGESSEEIVRSMIDSYERMFVFNNFRRYRTRFSTSGYFSRIFGRYFSVIGDQMQSLLYKYFYEPGFLNNEGPGGFYDMMRATVTGFDFLGNVLAQPESGSYEWDRDLQVYVNLEENLVDDAITGDEIINLPLGLGKPLWSSYEEGYFGVERLAYVGVFYDKLSAMMTLTRRDWGVDVGATDERFQLNFYDFFPGAYIDVLGTYMAGDFNAKPMHFQQVPGANGDTEVRLYERTFWDGSFFDADVGLVAEPPPGRPIEPGATTLINIYAIIYGMIDTPVYYDLSFTNASRVFEMGGQTSFDLSNVPANQVAQCTSPITNRTFVAVDVQEIPSIAIRAIDRCNELRAQYLELSAAIERHNDDPSTVLPDGMSRDEADLKLSRLGNRLGNQEDRLANLTYIGDLLGIGAL